MRRITIVLLGLAMLSVLTACGRKDSEDALRAMLEAEITQPILAFEYGDYDYDGAYEAFAFVGEEQDPEMDEGYQGELWFVNAGGAEQLEAGWYWGMIDVFTFGKNKFAVLNQYAVTGGCVSVWGVHAGEPRHENISGVGGGLRQINDSDFTLWHSTYDLTYDTEIGHGVGHTWKDYWFFWDGKAFHEYGGVNITETQLRKSEGAAEILEAILADGETIGDIFYRGNGIINVNHNYNVEADNIFHHVILQLNGTDVTVIEIEADEGIYRAALAPDIAVYPELPEIFN